MKYKWTKEFRDILETRLRTYHRHYRKWRPDTKFKDYIRYSKTSRYGNIDSFTRDFLKIKVGNTHFLLLDEPKPLSIVYTNANRRDCKC